MPRVEVFYLDLSRKIKRPDTKRAESTTNVARESRTGSWKRNERDRGLVAVIVNVSWLYFSFA